MKNATRFIEIGSTLIDVDALSFVALEGSTVQIHFKGNTLGTCLNHPTPEDAAHAYGLLRQRLVSADDTTTSP